jgi:SurA N-terminal domain
MQRMRAWRRISGGLLSAAAVLALVGCANAAPSVVAYVGDDRITQSEFDRAVGGINATLEEGQQVNRDAVVNAMIHGVLAEQIAANRNIAVTDAQREDALKGSDLAVLLTNPDAKSVAYDLADQQLVSNEVGADAYIADVREQTVTLNPRFGILDPQQKLITSVEETGSLSRPAPPPVATP